MVVLPMNVAMGSATMDPGVRRDDDLKGIGFKRAVATQA